MLITSIRQTSPGRLTVCFENGEELRSTLNVVTDLRLFSGRELDMAEYEELSLESRRALTREKAMDYLSRRAYSCKELERKLCDKGIEPDDASHCVSWLEERGLIDDESYAASVARHYTAKGYGPGRIRSELQKRGIERELWDSAFESVPQNTDKIDRFIAARLTDPEDRDQVRKVTAALFRRGHSWEAIRRALDRFNAEAEYEE